MKQLNYHLDLITPAFCGGAAPEAEAEIRASAIRGQLRWWIRALGGFARLAGKPIEEQAALVFGKAGAASPLVVRVAPLPGFPPLVSQARANADDLRAGPGTALGYALFPLRSAPRPDRRGPRLPEPDERRRGVMWPKPMRFALQLLWHGPAEMAGDIHALASVFGHLGGLGFRSRRGFGALAFAPDSPTPPLALADALAAFSPTGQPPVVVCRLGTAAGDWRGATESLLSWLRSWRQHGQMSRRWDARANTWLQTSAEQRAALRSQPGFRYARRDHNEGLDAQGARASYPDP
ncbi:MAG: type III-B CRISPR module RAMP protein Cmr1, partial [Verrucomicrobiae bacterium]|nr:type III-B CRISPR module RAMP protein Cmr1 [Verrucomicrobiae bacterium]